MLIAAARGAEFTRACAKQFLYDPERTFLTGPSVEMETLLHATRDGHKSQAIYRTRLVKIVWLYS